MRKFRNFFCVLVLFFFSISTSLYPQSYVVLIGDIPGIDSLVLLTKTLGEDMNVKLEIKKVPMQRMINMIIENQADFGAPMLKLKDPNVVKNLPYNYSTGVIMQMCFIIYTNKSEPIDINNLKNGNSNGYKIESDIANMQMFEFKTLPSTNPIASLQKVNDGLIDGYIMGSEPADNILKSNKDSLKNIKRQLWNIYDIGYLLPKGNKSSIIDNFLSEGLNKMKKNGKLQKILSDVLKSGIYDDWQP